VAAGRDWLAACRADTAAALVTAGFAVNIHIGAYAKVRPARVRLLACCWLVCVPLER
jgi:hypothetical protein